MTFTTIKKKNAWKSKVTDDAGEIDFWHDDEVIMWVEHRKHEQLERLQTGGERQQCPQRCLRGETLEVSVLRRIQ